MTELDRHQRPQDLRSVLHALGELSRSGSRFRDRSRQQSRFWRRGAARQAADHSRQVAGAAVRGLAPQSAARFPADDAVGQPDAGLDPADVRLSQRPRGSARHLERSRSAATSLSGQPVSLNKYLNFREAVYLPGTLDRIRAEAARDEREFGFAQLRLVICFLRWANLKDKPPGRYESPLLDAAGAALGEEGDSRPLLAHRARNAGRSQPGRAAPLQAVVRHRSARLRSTRRPRASPHFTPTSTRGFRRAIRR